VREAHNELRAQGLIESRRGVGTSVVRDKAGTTFAEAYSSVEDLIRTAKAAPVRPYDVQEVVADDALAQRLRGRVGQSYLRILAIRRHAEDVQPAAHVEVHIDSTYAGVAAQLHNLRHSIAETIEETFGLRIARIEQEISAVPLDEVSAGHLGVASGTPALLIRRWYAADTGRIFEAASSLYPTGHFTYRNVLLRQGGGAPLCAGVIDFAQDLQPMCRLVTDLRHGEPGLQCRPLGRVRPGHAREDARSHVALIGGGKENVPVLWRGRSKELGHRHVKSAQNPAQ
jgi:DNA-binding GntR family transcriptional regulator